MTKKARVMLFGKGPRKGIQIDADATKGARVGTDLLWPDGSPVLESQIRNPQTTVVNTQVGPVQVGPTLWSLILGIPAIIKSLALLATNGWLRNNSGTITADFWPYTKQGVATGETMTIPTGHELIVFRDFTMDGTVILDGDLVILE